MASIDNLFNLRGRVGNVVFCERKGKSYVRAQPMVVHNPKTRKQQAVRSRFRTAVRFYQRIPEVAIRAVLNISAGGVTTNGYALFMKLNLKVFKANGRVGDFSQMRFTVGSRQKAYDLAGRVDTSDGVELSWQNDENVGLEEMEDRLRVIVIYGDREFMPRCVADLVATRKEGRAEFRLDREKGVKPHLYCFFASPDGATFSNSQYICL